MTDSAIDRIAKALGKGAHEVTQTDISTYTDLLKHQRNDQFKQAVEDHIPGYFSTNRDSYGERARRVLTTLFGGADGTDRDELQEPSP
ncbi:MAG: hypothetical protein AAFX52_11895 [Pseudomonadota bacterium]